MWPHQQETADLVIFAEEILNGKLHFLYCALTKATSDAKNTTFDIISHWFLSLKTVFVARNMLFTSREPRLCKENKNILTQSQQDRQITHVNLFSRWLSIQKSQSFSTCSAEVVREWNLCWSSAKVIFIRAWYWWENFTSNFFWRTEERVRRAEIVIFDTKLCNYCISLLMFTLFHYQTISKFVFSVWIQKSFFFYINSWLCFGYIYKYFSLSTKKPLFLRANFTIIFYYCKISLFSNETRETVNVSTIAFIHYFS